MYMYIYIKQEEHVLSNNHFATIIFAIVDYLTVCGI